MVRTRLKNLGPDPALRVGPPQYLLHPLHLQATGACGGANAAEPDPGPCHHHCGWKPEARLRSKSAPAAMEQLWGAWEIHGVSEGIWGGWWWRSLQRPVSPGGGGQRKAGPMRRCFWKVNSWNWKERWQNRAACTEENGETINSVTQWSML